MCQYQYSMTAITRAQSDLTENTYISILLSSTICNNRDNTTVQKLGILLSADSDIWLEIHVIPMKIMHIWNNYNWFTAN